MEEREDNQPRTVDAGVDNGAVLDSRATTGNEKVDALNARILELQEEKEDIVQELRDLTKEREKISAGAVWENKLGNMNEAEVAAIQEALESRKAKAQSVGIEGIASREGVNGQVAESDE